MKVSLIQSNLFWENIDKNLNQFEHKIKKLADQTDLVILPEMFSTGFSMRPQKFAEHPDGRTFQWLKQMAISEEVAITGSYIVVENGHFYNRLVWMQPSGIFQSYDKRHLFSLSEEPAHYTAGEKKMIINWKGWKICPLICYDLRFPVWSRNVENYDLLIYVANWPERRAHHWRSLLNARAIENQAYTIGVNRIGDDGNGIYHSGDTSVIDFNGKLLFYTARMESVITLKLDFEKQQNFRKKYPFLADKDAFSFARREAL